jgi:hypothetical protein
MFSSTQTSPLTAIDMRFTVAVGSVRPWGQGRLHMDADILTLAGRSLR